MDFLRTFCEFILFRNFPKIAFIVEFCLMSASFLERNVGPGPPLDTNPSVRSSGDTTPSVPVANEGPKPLKRAAHSLINSAQKLPAGYGFLMYSSNSVGVRSAHGTTSVLRVDKYNRESSLGSVSSDSLCK